MVLEDQDECWGCISAVFLNVFICASFMVILMAVAVLVLKLLGYCEGVAGAVVVPETASETSGLLAKDVDRPVIIYGAFEEDEESGKCSRSSSSEDLYEGHVCVICYDKKRSCFFDPCGHCATCYACAKRIKEDARACPFCRRIIHRVRRLFSP